MRRPLIVVALVVMVVSAGCVGALADLPESSEDTSSDLPETDNELESTGNADDGAANVTGELEIHHFDVGQADSTLIITPANETILIDSGDWRQDGQGVIEKLEALDVDRIDHLVATHPHADHIGGHAAIIEHFEDERDGIGAAYDTGVVTTTNTFDRYLDAVDAYEVDLFTVEDGDSLPIEGSVNATVYNPPPGDRSSDLHDNSMVLALEFGEFQYLTTGDAESRAESRVLENHGQALETDVYQAGHHGSSTSSTEPFLDAVDPQIAVISSSLDSQYGHPHDEILEAFADRGIETYWTGVHGDIVVRTDGTTTTVETSTSFSTDPADLLAEKPPDDDEATGIGPVPVDAPLATGLIELSSERTPGFIPTPLEVAT